MSVRGKWDNSRVVGAMGHYKAGLSHSLQDLRTEVSSYGLITMQLILSYCLHSLHCGNHDGDRKWNKCLDLIKSKSRKNTMEIVCNFVHLEISS